MRMLFAALTIGVGTAAAATAGSPSFDCSKADGSAEQAVCASDALSALDRELATLYARAINGPHMTDYRAAELRAYQRGWVKGRNDCWKSDPIDVCIRNSYAIRIHEIRRGYSDARVGDNGSTGPFPYICEGLNSVFSVAFVSAGDPLVSLNQGATWLTLPLTPAGSGARYADGAGVEFWIKGTEATFTAPDGRKHACHQDDMG